jgi:hypothetical protein
MIALGIADLVVIAGRTLGLDTAEVLGLLDPAAAERALLQAFPGGAAAGEAAAGGPVTPTDPAVPAARAAALLHALVHERPLPRGNRQVALAATLQFLALNGWHLDPDPPGPVAAMVAQAAAGDLGVAGVADWLAPRLRPADHRVIRLKEALMRQRLLLADKAGRLKAATMRIQPTGMFQRFTDRSRRVIYLAQEEARLLRHDHVGTEHLLLGLLYEGEGVAATALESLDISLEELRRQVEERIGHGESTVAGGIPFTPQARRVLEQSLRQALLLGHSYLGTEHLLLGLLCEEDSVAARVLVAAGADHARVRERVLGLLVGGGGLADPRTSTVQVNVPAGLIAAAEQLAEVREAKQAAFDEGRLDAAAALRDREKQLRAEKLRLEHQLTAGMDVEALVAENQWAHREVDRLRDLLRRHGIEPDAGTAQSA